MKPPVNYCLDTAINGFHAISGFTSSNRAFKCISSVWLLFIQVIATLKQQLSSIAPKQPAFVSGKLTPKVSAITICLEGLGLTLPDGWLTETQLRKLTQRAAQKAFKQFISPEGPVLYLRPLTLFIRLPYRLTLYPESDSSPISSGL